MSVTAPTLSRASDSRAMDDLDRLAFRLVRTIRQRFPQLRDGGFALDDLETTLLPYRDARRELAEGTANAFERTMLRLVSGERGYLETDAELQAACRDALAQPSPTMALVRASTTSTLQLGPAALTVGVERVSGAFEAVHGTSQLETPRETPRETPTRTAAHQGCRHCGGRLPEARAVTFCPHCGLDLSKRQCPACSTQLEIAWRFCVTCGRSAALPDYPVRTPAREPLQPLHPLRQAS